MRDTGLSSRERSLLHYLMREEAGATVEELAEQFRVSSRSMYDALRKVRTYLEECGCQLQKSGKRYFLSREDAVRLGEEERQADGEEGFSSGSRKYQIIEYLTDKRTTTLQEIADHLYFSKSTIYHEMKVVEKILSKFSLHLVKKPYHGMMLDGTEKDIRFMLQYLLEEQMSDAGAGLEEITFAHHFLRDEGDEQLRELLHRYPAFDNLESYLSLRVMLYRMRKGCVFTASGEIRENYEGSALKRQGEQLLGELGERLGLEPGADEVYYLLLGTESGEAKGALKEDVCAMAEAIMETIQEKHPFIDVREGSFYTGLIVHVSAMLRRIRFGKVARNPILGEIKESFPLAFNVAADITMMLENRFAITLNEDEIGLFAMHIQVMLEENRRVSRKSRTGIVVSHIGYGNARMIAGRLFDAIPSLSLSHILSFAQMEELIREGKIGEDEAIISTRLLSLPRERYCLVQPLITQADAERVKEYLHRWEKKRERPKRQGFLEKLSLEHIYPGRRFRTKEELLAFACERLEETGYVTEEFYESTLSREKISTTYALNGVALPHGYSRWVKKPVIAVITLERPLDWDGYYTDMVFVCALSLGVEEGDRKIFEEMYMLLNDRETLRRVKECADAASILRVFGSFAERMEDED